MGVAKQQNESIHAVNEDVLKWIKNLGKLTVFLEFTNDKKL